MSSRFLFAASLLALSASPVLAQEHEPVNLLEPHSGLIFWTILVFIATMLLLRKLAFGPILAAVRSREQSLTDAIAAAENPAKTPISPRKANICQTFAAIPINSELSASALCSAFTGLWRAL